MTTEGWIFMVGLRVFDVGALIVWLVWFYRLRDEPDDDGDDRGDGPGPELDAPAPRAGPPGLDLPLLESSPWPARRRDHGGDRCPATAPARRPQAPVHRPARPIRARRR